MSAPEHVELLLFEIGGTRYGADASQVLRIDRPDPHGESVVALGAAQREGRALVFSRSDRPNTVEEQLRVDAVLGVRTVAVDSLRRLPPAAAGNPCAIGVWLDGDHPVLLVDLWKTQTAGQKQ